MRRILPARPQAAFSLVEVTLALGIAAFCLVAVFGLLPIGVNTNRENVEQTTAAQLASALAADLRSTPGTVVNTPLYGIALPIPGGTVATTSLFLNADGSTSTTATGGPNATFRATITATPPASGRAASSVRIWITWPGSADSNKSSPPAHYSGSFLTVVGLDRN